MERNERVKGHLRKGRVVRGFVRRVEKNSQSKQKSNLIRNLAIGAGIAGVPVAAFAGLRMRYLNNLKQFAKNLKPNPNLGKVIASHKADITFAIGGVNYKRVPGDYLQESSSLLASGVKKGVPLGARRGIAFVPILHQMDSGMILSESKGLRRLRDNLESFQRLGSPVVRGTNPQSQRIAEEIYSYAVKNPGKRISIVGYSAGGNVAKDVQYILEQKNIPVKVAAIGTSDARIHTINPKATQHIYNPYDAAISFTKPRKAFVPKTFPRSDPGEAHSLATYLKNKETLSRLYSFLYS
jgi:hypothetical protein